MKPRLIIAALGLLIASNIYGMYSQFKLIKENTELKLNLQKLSGYVDHSIMELQECSMQVRETYWTNDNLIRVNNMLKEKCLNGLLKESE